MLGAGFWVLGAGTGCRVLGNVSVSDGGLNASDFCSFLPLARLDFPSSSGQ